MIDTGTANNRKYEDNISIRLFINKNTGNEKAIILIIIRNNLLAVLSEYIISINEREVITYGISKGATLYITV